MRIRESVSLLLALALVMILLSPPAEAGSETFEILINTSSLAQGSGGLVDIQLSPAYAPLASTVSARVFAPATDGTISPGASLLDPAMGTATGDLNSPGGVVMNNTAFSEIGQDFSVRSFLDVDVTLAGTEIGPGATGSFTGTVFTLTVFDSQTADAGLSAIFTVNPEVDSNGDPVVDGSIGVSTSDSTVSVIQAASVPEPSSILLLGVALAAIGVFCRSGTTARSVPDLGVGRDRNLKNFRERANIVGG
jgi:hypothetical protein